MRWSRVTVVLFAAGLFGGSAGFAPASAQEGGPATTAQPPAGGLPGPHDPAAAADAGRAAQSQEAVAAPGSGFAAGAPTASTAAVGPGSAVTYRVFATQYKPETDGSVEVALPDKCAKFAARGDAATLGQLGCPSGYALGLDYRVSVSRDSGQTAAIRVNDAGPWNIDDNYWDGGPGSPRPRRMFGDLPRGTPESQAAFSQGYNTQANCKDLNGNATNKTAGADQFGRCVLNPAGIDLSFAAAAQLGLSNQNEWVNVTFLWESSGTSSKPAVARGPVRYLRQEQTSGPADLSYRYGDPGDLPVMGDWDGNGTRTPGVVRNGTWYLSNSNTTGRADIVFGYGDAGDLPVVGDWNGDGVDTPGVVRRGTWYLRNSNSTGNADIAFGYGDPGDVPVVGDWNADGVDTPGVVRRGTWYLRNSNSTGNADIALGYGDPSDLPVVGDWNGDGSDTPGVVRGGTWYLRNSNTTGAADVAFGFGNSTDTPLVWR